LQHVPEGASTSASVRKSMHGVIPMNHDKHDDVVADGAELGDGDGDGASASASASEGSALVACVVVVAASARARKRAATSLEDPMAACVAGARAFVGDGRRAVPNPAAGCLFRSCSGYVLASVTPA
jgi:hypothetical protein